MADLTKVSLANLAKSLCPQCNPDLDSDFCQCEQIKAVITEVQRREREAPMTKCPICEGEGIYEGDHGFTKTCSCSGKVRGKGENL